MRRRHLESVSSRSLSVRGSWGLPQVAFELGPPAGRKARWGKEERRSVGGLPIPIGIATRHGAKPATTHTSKRNASAVAVQIMPLRKPAPTILNHKNPARSFLAPGGKLDACFIVLGCSLSSTVSRCPTPAHKYPPCAGCSERFPGRSHRTGLHPPPPRRR